MGCILVTGGAGFIGSRLAKRLLQEGHRVFIIDNLATGYQANVPDGATFINGDAADWQILRGLKGEKLDAIYHFSGQSSGEISFDDPLRDLSDNTGSTLAICDFMARNGVKKIIYASSLTVYGEPTSNPVSEDMETVPKSFYAVGKLASENYLRIYHQNYGLDVLCLRLFSIYGPGQNMANMRQGIASIFLEMMIKNHNPIEVHGPLERFRDLMHIDDLLEILTRLLNLDLPGFQTLNVGTGMKTEIRDILKYLGQALKKSPEIVVKGETPGDVFGIYANIERLLQAIDYSPKICPEEGLKSFAKWYAGRVKFES